MHSMTSEHKATLKSCGCTDEQCSKLAAMPSVNWLALMAFIQKYATMAPGLVTDLLAIFATLPNVNWLGVVAFVQKYATLSPTFVQDLLAIFSTTPAPTPAA